MAMLPRAMIRMNHRILMLSPRSRQATQQKNVRKPQYASYKVAIDQGLAAKAPMALHKLTCKLVRTVMTVVKMKIAANKSFRKAFMAPPCAHQLNLIYYVYVCRSDVPAPYGAPPRGAFSSSALAMAPYTIPGNSRGSHRDYRIRNLRTRRGLLFEP